MLPSSHSNQWHHDYIFTSATSGSHGVECFQWTWAHHLNYVFSTSLLVSLVLTKFLVKHATGQMRVLILVVPGWMKVSWSLQLIKCRKMSHASVCSMIKDFVRSVLIGLVFEVLPLLHLMLCLHRNMCCADSGSLSQSVRQ